MTPQPDPGGRPPRPAGRSFRLALAALIAVLSTFTVAAVAMGRDADRHGQKGHTMRHGGRISHREFGFRQDMRKLWEDHVTWTRLAVLSLTTDSPDTSATVGRLLQNQTDIGNAVKPFYGTAAGNQLTALLREHILIAADLIAAARAGDAAGVATQSARWTANADQIAAFLHSANLRHFKLGEMKAMMHEHLRLTTSEVLARLHQDWDADVAAYDAIHVQALNMADMLSTGIVAQFPRRFR
jgi:hypothetical protein